MILTIEDNSGPVMQIGRVNTLVPSRQPEKDAVLALLAQAIDLLEGPIMASVEPPREAKMVRSAS